jgi:hypothetical protein
MGARRGLENLGHRLLLLSFSVLRGGKWLSRISIASWFIRLIRLIVYPRECHMVLFLVREHDQHIRIKSLGSVPSLPKPIVSATSSVYHAST